MCKRINHFIFIAIFLFMSEGHTQVAELVNSVREAYKIADSIEDDEQAISVLEEAYKNAEKALELDPKSAPAQFWLASCAGRMAQRGSWYQKVSKGLFIKGMLERAVELDPNVENGMGLYALAQFHFQAPRGLGNAKEGLEYLKRAVELNPSNETYLRELEIRSNGKR